MKHKKSWLVHLTFILLLGMLSACTGNEEPAGGEEDKDGNVGEVEAKMGGTAKGAMDTAPKGLFNPILYTDSYDNNILSFTHEGLLDQDENLDFIPSLAKSWEINEDKTEVVFKLEENVIWHDGEPFTADDVVFTYKSIASPGYIEAGGTRETYVERLLGYEEFSTGKTTEFKGVVAVDDHTVKFVYAQSNVLALADAALSYLLPEHVFKDIPVSEMPEAAASITPGEIIGTGPFKLSKMIEGEQYVLEKHKEYWQGEPYLDSVVWNVVDQSVILGLLENGEIDFVADPNGFEAADYETIAALDHLEIIEQPDFGYQVMGFMHNHRSKEEAEAGIMKPENWEPNKKLSDKRVRQAIAYAIDRQGIIDGLLYSHGSVINAPIATQFWAYDDENPNQYEFNVEKSKGLLDEAGYIDTNGDGFREDPDGHEWILNFNYPTGNVTRERSVPIIVEMLQEVGIQINLRQPKDFQAYWEDLDKHSQDWDLFVAGWSLDSSDPDPTGVWSSKVNFNISKWYNPKADQLLLDAVTPPDALEQEYRQQVYSEWQVMFQDELPALILYAKNTLWAHNTRIQGIEVLPYTFINEPHLWNVTK